MSIPRGFYETFQDCDKYTPAFVRGVLITREQAQGNFLTFLEIPRWVLYAGPFSDVERAQVWDVYLAQWAMFNGLFWISDATPCIVKRKMSQAGSGLPWPPDSSLKWTWVYEKEPPRKVEKYWDDNRGLYRYKWEYGSDV